MEKTVDVGTLILETIIRNKGIKEVELSLSVMSQMGPAKFDTFTFFDLLTDLVRTQKIKKFLYVIDKKPYVIYFPPETVFYY